MSSVRTETKKYDVVFLISVYVTSLVMSMRHVHRLNCPGEVRSLGLLRRRDMRAFRRFYERVKCDDSISNNANVSRLDSDLMFVREI